MRIIAKCPGCGNRWLLDAGAADRRIKCPKCHKSFMCSGHFLAIEVKAPKGRATGRTFTFMIVDYGANLHNIREVVKCRKCWGKGYIRSGQNNIRCQECDGKKYVDKYGD